MLLGSSIFLLSVYQFKNYTQSTHPAAMELASQILLTGNTPLDTDNSKPLDIKQESGKQKSALNIGHNQSKKTPAAATENSSASLALTFHELEKGNLPISSVEEYSAENAKGTVIFLPQIHKYPGSSNFDPANNQAAQVQKETLEILSTIIKKIPVNLIMVEGENFGIIKNDKKQNITDLATTVKEIHDEFSGLENNLKASPPQNNESISQMNSGKQYVENIKNELLLVGAPYLLWLENTDIILYGSENPETLKECQNIVRNYLYLQDRVATASTRSISSFSMINPVQQRPSANNQLNLQNMASPQMIFQSYLNQLLLSGNGKIKIEAQNLLQNITKYTALTASQNTTENLPSRNNNPYANITDIKILKDLMKQAEENINSTIIEKRNIETAKNVSVMLETENSKIGILQFGAGHSDGLIKALNNEGLNVIEITPFSVTALQ